MTNKHTPTPWKISSKGGTLIYKREGNNLHCIASTEIATLDDGSANAAFIVKAVNNHEKLVEALKLISKLGKEGMRPDPNEWLTFHDKVAQIADEALLTSLKLEEKSNG